MSTGLLERARRRTTDAEHDADPRILARRAGVRADRGRRRRRWLLAVAVVATLAAAIYGIAHSRALDVDEIVVVGAVHTPADQVAAASGIRAGDELVTMDLVRAEGAVRSLPWVDSAAVTRDWRNGIVTVTVTERTPVAVLLSDPGEPGDAGGPPAMVAVDAQRRALAYVGEPGDLPLVSGPPVAPGGFLDESSRPLVASAAGLSASVRSRTIAVRNGPSGVELELRPAGVARLGDADRIAAKARSLETVFAQVDLRCLATVDVRVADAPVLTRDPACA